MKSNKKNPFAYLPMDVARGVFWLLRLYFHFRAVDVSGNRYKGKPEGCAVIVANHTGFIDPLVLDSLFCRRRMFILTAKEVMATPIREFLLTKAGCIKIDRSISDMAAIRNCVGILKEGNLLGMFPEGRINREGEPDRIKSGAVLIALQAGAPIIPLYSKKPARWWHRRKVVVGEPFSPADVCQKRFPSVADLDQISHRLSQKIEECKVTYEQRYE